MAREPVRLNIYDMYWVNDYLSSIGVGVFHSGLEVYGVEYAYGGHPFAFTGVFENAPKDAEELGENFRYRETVDIGYTDFTEEDIQGLVSSIGQDFRGDKYHLINKNCNHFTAHLSKTLCGTDIPQWVNRLASISGSIPFLERMLPQEWLTPIALQQSLEERRRTQSTDENVGSRLAASNNTVDTAEDAYEYHALPPDISTLRLTAHPPEPQSSTTTTATESSSSTSSNSSSSTDANGTPTTKQRVLNFPTSLINILTGEQEQQQQQLLQQQQQQPGQHKKQQQQQSIADLLDSNDRMLDELERR